MKSITIHNLDDTLAKIIQQKASEEGMSLNQTIKKLLEQALGIKPKPIENKKDFSEFFSSWTDDDLLEFQKSTNDFNIIDKEDWK